MTSGSATAGILFEEDFDLPPEPPAPPEPEVIEPVFSSTDLESARAEAWQEGHDAATAEAEAASVTQARAALARISAEIAATRQEAADLAEESADCVARLLMEGFAAAFPALCANHGRDELVAVIRTVLPAVHLQPSVTIRLNPHLAGAVAQEIERLEPDLCDRIQVVPTDAIPEGDVRISWRNGGAVRDTAALWSEIASILGANGLLPVSAAKELAHVE